METQELFTRTPHDMGWFDGYEGLPFMPWAYYVSDADVKAYAEGYMKTRANELAAHVAGHANYVPAVEKAEVA